MSIDQECERIEDDPNLTQQQKEEQILELERDARDAYDQYTHEQDQLKREYGY